MPFVRARRRCAIPAAVLTCATCNRAPSPAASAQSRAIIAASPSASTPQTPSRSATAPACIAAPALCARSSSWAITGAPTSAAASSARRIMASRAIGMPSSENATAPAARSAAKSVSSSPARPFVTAAIGSTCANPTSAARARIQRVTSTVSFTGSVFAIAATVVKPPAIAAATPDAIVSLCSPPGSRRCTCMSMSPGITQRPAASRTARAFGPAPGAATPITFPSSISTSPTTSRDRTGSSTRPPAMARSIIAPASCRFRVDVGVDDDRVLVLAIELAEPHPHALVRRRRQMLADIGGLDRQLAVSAVDEHRETGGARPAGAPDRCERVLHRPAGVDHVVDEHDRAIGDLDRLGVRLPGPAPNAVGAAVHVDDAEVDLSAALVANALREAVRDVGTGGLDADDDELVQLGGIGEDRVGQRVEAVVDLLGVHDRLLRPELVGLVARLLGLLHRVEDHERAVTQPAVEVAVHRLVVDVEMARLAVADDENARLVVTVEADEVPGAGALAVQAEARVGRDVLATRDAVRVGAARTDADRPVAARDRLRRARAGRVVLEEKRDQRHAHRHAVRRLLEVDGARVAVERRRD